MTNPALPLPSLSVLELALGTGGEMHTVDWLGLVRSTAAVGMRHLILTIPHPTHPRAQVLWECGVACGMHVTLSAVPTATSTDHAPRIRVAAGGVPRLVIPDGIPLTDLQAALGPDLAGFASPSVLRALEAAAPHRQFGSSGSAA